MKISFIGAGHVAWHLAQALENAGNSVQEVFSRDPKKAKEVVSFCYNAQVQEHLDFSESTSDVFFLCIPETAYAQVLSELLLPKYGTLVLVSGTAALAEAMVMYDPLRESMNQMGVFFPVQQLSTGRKISLAHMPICVEVLVEETEITLVTLAKDISDAIYVVSGEERKKIFLAMQMAGVFTNQLWTQAKQLLDSIDLDTQLIQGVVENHMKAFFTQQIIPSAPVQLNYETLAFIEKPEMQEIYKQMVLLSQRSLT